MPSLGNHIAVSALGLVQTPTAVNRFEYTDIGGGKIQVEVQQGTRDQAGNFVEQSSYRFVITADAATTAALKKAHDSVKNRLTALANSL